MTEFNIATYLKTGLREIHDRYGGSNSRRHHISLETSGRDAIYYASGVLGHLQHQISGDQETANDIDRSIFAWSKAIGLAQNGEWGEMRSVLTEEARMVLEMARGQNNNEEGLETGIALLFLVDRLRRLRS